MSTRPQADATEATPTQGALHSSGRRSASASARGHASEDSAWLTRKERGTIVAIRVTYAIITLCGRRATKGFVALIALYYVLRGGPGKQASFEFLSRVYGRSATFGEVYRHFRTFAQVTADRIFLLKDQFDVFDIALFGHEHIQRATDEKYGIVLVNAHVGSFEAMRAAGRQVKTPISIVGHFENARMVNGLLQRLNPENTTRVIHIGSEDFEFIYEMEAAIARGELLGLMGDRVGLTERSVTVDFMGHPARFPLGPFLLGAILGCPVYSAFSVYEEPNRYKLYCEPLMPAGKIPPKERQRRLEQYVQDFARRLEAHVLQHPNNWFNFFDFWGKPRESNPPA